MSGHGGYPVYTVGDRRGRGGAAASAAACLKGSTEFYEVTPENDKYTPSYLEAKPLAENVGVRRSDGTLPPWVADGDPSKSPCEQYVEWFNYIWTNGDPSSWNATVFTNNAVILDPSGITTGANESASIFRLLFRFFPKLRGEVVSWAANERELFINWRFRIPNTGKGRLPIGPITQALQEEQGGRDYLVPVVDKFCFVDGRVSFRVAYFDIITLTGYLSENFSANELYDYLIAFTWTSLTRGGLPLVPKMIINLILGLFIWPPKPEPTGLEAFAGGGQVTLRWPRVAGADSYRVTRAVAIEGPYVPPPPGGDAVEKVHTNTFTDRHVEKDKPYWYLVTPNLKAKKRSTIQESVEITKRRSSTY